MGERAEVLAARQKLKERFGGGSRVGGKGTVRRKKKAVQKSANNDDKKLQSSLKRLGVNPIHQIETVEMWCEDDTVVTFKKPQVQASIAANTYSISGPHERTQGVMPETGPSMAELQALMASMQAKAGTGAAPAGDDDDDDDVPDLVENFDEVSE